MNLYLEKMLGFHCAPTLMYKKMANLVVLKCKFFLPEELDAFNIHMNENNIFFKTLKVTKENHTLLVYNKEALSHRLNGKDTQEFLGHYNYTNFTLVHALEHLCKRYNENVFPHEIGIFLDYPLEDVKGFIDNKGKNFIFSGYWKVYKFSREKNKLFSEYTKCRCFLCQLLADGANLCECIGGKNENRNNLLVSNW
ncbi:MAG: DUF3793 family protein [Lachnospirales bacterium]